MFMGHYFWFQILSFNFTLILTILKVYFTEGICFNLIRTLKKNPAQVVMKMMMMRKRMIMNLMKMEMSILLMTL